MAVQFRDYYETLGVPKTASDDDIKKAFRKFDCIEPVLISCSEPRYNTTPIATETVGKITRQRRGYALIRRIAQPMGGPNVYILSFVSNYQ